MTMDFYDVIRVPLITEKGTRLKEKNNVLTFFAAYLIISAVSNEVITKGVSMR